MRSCWGIFLYIEMYFAQDTKDKIEDKTIQKVIRELLNQTWGYYSPR